VRKQGARTANERGRFSAGAAAASCPESSAGAENLALGLLKVLVTFANRHDRGS
jgi:hypothetical protein